MIKFSSVIFDWDGTLGMTLHLWLEGYKSELHRLGYDFSDRVVIDDFFFEHDKGALKYPQIDFKELPKQAHKYIIEEIVHVKTYPGARECLEKLRANNITLTLVSSSPRRVVKRGLEAVGLEEFFPVIVAGDDVMKHKPDPEPFNNIIEIGKLDRSSTIIIGDSNTDIVAAKAAGLKSCLFLPEENKLFYDFSVLALSNPDYQVLSLKDFADLITEV